MPLPRAAADTLVSAELWCRPYLVSVSHFWCFCTHMPHTPPHIATTTDTCTLEKYACEYACLLEYACGMNDFRTGAKIHHPTAARPKVKSD